MYYDKFHGEVLDDCIPTDQILRSYFPDHDYIGTIVEIGAFDPIKISNSYHFEQNGWLAYCIEANHLNFDKFSIRKHALNYACADRDEDDVDFTVVTSSNRTAGFSSLEVSKRSVEKFGGESVIQSKEQIKVRVRKFDTLLATEMPEVKTIDILTIDVEGCEMQVFAGFDLQRWKPKLIFVEDVFPDEGNSPIAKHMAANGYKLDRRDDYNSFYLLTETTSSDNVKP